MIHRFPGSETPMRVILHIGAHKTATTYLQRRLDAHRTVLETQGVAYAGPDQLREHAARRLPFTAPHLVAVRVALARARKQGAARLILSEENLLGPMADLPRGLYLDPARRLAPVIKAELEDYRASLAPQHP